MKRKVVLGILLVSICFPVFSQVDTTFIYNPSMPYGTLDLRLAKSVTRYHYLQEDVTFSYRETEPGVKSTTYRDMTSWESSPYKQGNLREKNGTADLFVMNYRMLFPLGYDPSYDQGYPIIIMLHGAGEGGNCWNDNCYWATPAWNPNTNNPAAPSTELDLLNNDRNLFHGGSQHLNAVKAAGTRLPSDPSMPTKAFPGFILFPQALNGWSQPSKVEDAIRILRLVIKKYNIDENRVYIHGLSNGGGGVNQALKRAPWLFASALTMSAISDGEIALHNMLGEVRKLPLWIFQGGQDTNPTPTKTFSFVKKLRDAGAVVRYYLYPSLGHGTWNSAYKEPDFFSWILDKRKYNPHISFGNPVICNTTGAGVRLAFSNGFLAYEWEKDGVIVSGQSNSEFIANTPGVYRGRFSRKSITPTESEWERWSDPINVSEINPAKPSIEVTGTTHLRGPGLSNNDLNNKVTLGSAVNADLYEWYKNGQLINFNFTDIDDTLNSAPFTSASNASNGAYSLVIKNSYCPSPPSDPVYLYFNNTAPQNIAITNAATNLLGVPNSSSVFLSWNDVVTNETGYEIWRKKSGGSFIFVTKTDKDAISHIDTGLEPGTTYEYKFRAINNAGRSNYIPSDLLTINYSVTTLGDFRNPGAPQNLIVASNSIDNISLSWEPASDDNGIKQYLISYDSLEILVPGTITKFTLTDLPANTLFPISIKAQDFAGHWSQPSNQIIGTTYVLTLNYKHSTGAWTDLDDTTLIKTFINPEYIGTTNNFSLASRTQEDFYNFQFTGFLNLTTGGEYLFRTTSDDGSRLIIDDSTIVDNDGKHGNKTITSDTVLLTSGLHRIEVQYFDNNGFQNLVVQYWGPGIGDGSFINIPDSALKSGEFSPPPLPEAPINPTANATAMQQVSIGWEFQSEDDSTDYEIFRGIEGEGPFIIVGRSPLISFIDSVQLQPGLTYYYKIRTLNRNGSSEFSPVVSTTTFTDSEPPGIPTNLQLLSKTYTSIALSWNPSTDNVGTKEYQVYANGVFLGKTSINSFTATDLIGINYSFTVKALDVSGNASEQSSPLVVDNTISGMFFSLATGNLNELTTWKKNADGTGPSPSAFSTDGQTFVIRNRVSTNLAGPWSVMGLNSKIVVPEGTTLDLDNACSCTIELLGNSILNLNHTTIPGLINISESSTVNFNAYGIIPKNHYGNILLTGTGSKTFSGDTTLVSGNIVVSNGLSLNGNESGTGNIKLRGNINFEGIESQPRHDIHLIFTSNALHTLQTSGDISFYKISAAENANIKLSSGNTVTIKVGSQAGGGLNLANGAMLALAQNHLEIKENGTINSTNETGKISISGGNLFFNSTANSTSHLYFSETDHLVSTLSTNFTAGGAVAIHSLVTLEDEINLKNGILDAGGFVTLLSNSETSARISKIENGQITGAITVQKYLPVEGKIWRDLSVPVSGITVAAMQAYFPVTGNFAGASSGPGLTSDPSLFISGGNKNELIAYPTSSQDNTAPIEKGKGYASFMHSLNDSTPTILALHGIPHQGNVTYALNPGNGTAQQGWNLIGNPYASGIRWAQGEGWIRNGISKTIAIRTSKLEDSVMINQYHYYNTAFGETYIEPGQAFWVQASSAQSSLTITESAKASDAGESSAPDPSLKFIAINLTNEQHHDPSYIFFSPNATNGYDAMLDVAKFQNEGMFSLSTFDENGNDLAFNYLNDNFSCATTVNLNLQSMKEGTYTFTFEHIENIPDSTQVMLNDKFTGAIVSLTSNEYSFTVSEDVNSFANRFSLVFSNRMIDLLSPVIESQNACPQTNGMIQIHNSQTAVEYSIVNTGGEIISNTVTGNGGTILLAIPFTNLVAGVNIFNVQAGFPNCIEIPFPQEVTLNYTEPFDVNVLSDVSACAGSSLSIQASGVPMNGHYQWYDASGIPIAGAEDSVYVIHQVDAEAIYAVEAISDSGCKSAVKSIAVHVITTEKPVITFANDTLFSSTTGPYQWKKDSVLLIGEINNFFVPLDSGSYSVEIFNGNCTAESDPFEFKIPDPDPDNDDGGTDDGGTDEIPIVGTDPDLSRSFALDLYPVPNHGENINMRVHSPAIADVLVRIVHTSGQEKFRKLFSVAVLSEGISVSPAGILAEGIYVVIVRQGDLEIRRRIVVKD